MKENNVLVDMKKIADNNNAFKEICDNVIVKQSAIGIMLSSIAKEEANAKLQKGLCEFKLENNKFMFENEDDRYKVFVPDKFIKVNVGIEKELLEHYLDGYKTIKIEDYKDENNCLLSGESSEMKKLMYALGRNCIRMY